MLGAGAASSDAAISRALAQQAPGPGSAQAIRIFMGGYGPSTTGFSLALKRIGDRMNDRFGSAVDVRYVYNIMDLGYLAADILWLVEQGLLTLGYQSSSYFEARVPNIGITDLPFLFADPRAARAAMDGALGDALTAEIEANMDYRVLGYFENGFRQISNRLRPIRTLEDLRGMKIRVLPSEVHARCFELLGADPKVMDLSEALRSVKDGTVDAQENPFANTVTYGVHEYHRFHSITNHIYISRPIMLHRATFDAWPVELQLEFRAAVKEAVSFQRELHTTEEIDAAATIRASGGEILDLDAEQLQPFRDAIRPLYAEARERYDPKLVALAGI